MSGAKIQSHGVPRVSEAGPVSEEAKQLQQVKIDKYLALVSQVNQKASEGLHDEDTLTLTSKLLSENPEYYTVWNQRRRMLTAQIGEILQQDPENKDSSVEAISKLISSDLRYLIPLLQKFPKCYWLWNHRSWLLTQAERRLPASVANKFWTEELGLVTKMHARDSRNFHAWGYRRRVVEVLERLGRERGDTGSMAEKEFEYTRSMIGRNLSNFSAWHARSKLLLKIAAEKGADDATRKKMLDEELDLIHEALIDPRDQSLWYYHQFLATAFDPKSSGGSVAPNLSTADRLKYLQNELEYVLEMLDDAENVKWIYLSLIELSSLYHTQSREWPVGVGSEKVREWTERLEQIDPKRRGRWQEWSRVVNAVS